MIKIPNYQSLKVEITTTFIFYPFQKHPKETLLYNFYCSMEHVLPTIIDLFQSTVHVIGGQGYKFGVFT